VDPSTYQRVVKALEKVGAERLRPIFEELQEKVPYDQIRISLSCWKNSFETGTETNRVSPLVNSPTPNSGNP
jgi:hypothetical protein